MVRLIIMRVGQYNNYAKITYTGFMQAQGLKWDLIT